MLPSVVFAREEAVQIPSALILARLDAIGAAEVARRVVPLWGHKHPDQALERLSRYRAHLEGRGGRDMTTEPFFALLSVLGGEIRFSE